MTNTTNPAFLDIPAAILRAMGGYQVRETGTSPEPTAMNSRPCLTAAVKLVIAIEETAEGIDLEIVDLTTGEPADDGAVCAILETLD